ncbi:hypothetical protein SAMN02746073_2058 [Legionella jamestowniensis DSM 19215]|uniref:Uncharacterized protein n=2 Tax=Legionella jamestowniensis TaxID=455 RepID=A0A0W0UG05_9GAMM|nr:hypothetical protein Ljam_1054 [Legionella jamestowniensis]SFL82148.1 hypothetical protein SAMN02746073_2058 [Legionella jamestowniensis DSM 19215]
MGFGYPIKNPSLSETMKSAEYTNTLLVCMQQISSLPPSEIKYHLLLLINTLKENNTAFTLTFLKEVQQFLNYFHRLVNLELSPTEELQDALATVLTQYQRLIAITKVNSMQAKIIRGLITLGASILALVLGITSGLIGSIAGFARGLWNFHNPFSSFAIGLVTGLLLGATFGFRIPKKLFKNEFFRQLKFCLDGMYECIESMQQNKMWSIDEYKEEVKQRLLTDYFKNDEIAFKKFLQNQSITYEINTLRARFISPSLEGYLGQHAFIKIIIEEQSPPLILEFSTAQSDLKRPISQGEHRIVSGEKIVEMLAFHEQLQVTHACTVDYMVLKMKPGENDCLSYVNKLLIGTSQQATIVKRFDGKENWLGKHVIGFFVKNLSPFKQDIFLENQLELEGSLLSARS